MRKTSCCTKLDFLVELPTYRTGGNPQLVRRQFDGSWRVVHMKPFYALTDLRLHTRIVP